MSIYHFKFSWLFTYFYFYLRTLSLSLNKLVMKQALLKAMAKKQQFFAKMKQQEDSDDSDASLTSDDEDEVSENMVYQWFNGNRYLCLKYLGRGTFCRVWLVYDMEDDEFYAMKVQFPKYYEDSQEELKINRLINNRQRDSRLIKLMNSFVYHNSEGKHTCFIYELMGGTLLDIFKAYEDDNIPMNLCKKLIKEIFSSLAELHSLGIIHTDLKPENIMIKKKNENIDKIIKILSPLKLTEVYQNIVNEHLPEDYSEYNKIKRKNVKRRIKPKCYKKFSEFVAEKLKKLNNHDEIIDITNTDVDDLVLENTTKLKDFDIDNLNLKIIDFGNAEHIGKRTQDEIMIRNYRPPENIMNEYYDEKADVWSVGCIIYEIFTGDYLFEVDKNQKTIEKDREHLHQMFEILGKIPRDMALDCDFTEDLFDNKGRILKRKTCEYTSLEEILKNDFDYSEEDAKQIDSFLRKVLAYNLKDRYSALEAANDSWINN